MTFIGNYKNKINEAIPDEFKELFEKQTPELESKYFHLNIIIQYRARGINSFRSAQLKIAVNVLLDYLKKHNYSFTIYVLEQDNDNPFNRGMLCNAGFLEIEKIKTNKINYYCQHNCDLFINKNQNPDYSFIPINVIRDFGDYKAGLGGISFINRDTYYQINGFANNLESWGGDDTCIMSRIIKHNIKLTRHNYPPYFTEIKGNADSRYNSRNIQLSKNNTTGVDNCQYSVTKKYDKKIIIDNQELFLGENVQHIFIDFPSDL